MILYNFLNLIALTPTPFGLNLEKADKYTILLGQTVDYLRSIELGLSFQNIQLLMFIITLIRFFIYASNYNVKTGFYIACISLFAATIWYIHLIYILREYNSLTLTNFFSGKLWITYAAKIDARTDVNIFYKSIILLSRLFGNINKLYTMNFDKKEIEMVSFRIDPFSMIFSIMPESIKQYSDKIYYTISDRIGPSIFIFLAENVFISKMSFLYLLIVRYGKRYCPYLIRWHWTYVMMYTIITPIFIRIPYRLEIFSQLVLLPENRLREFFLAKFIILIMMTGHLLLIILPLLHALLGQYFFIPYLTRNVELHVGLRPKDSIYSGGYTAWQEFSLFLKEIGEEKVDLPFRIWWGWFGRGVESVTPNSPKTNRRNIFKKLRKFIKNFFKFFKQ